MRLVGFKPESHEKPGMLYAAGLAAASDISKRGLLGDKQHRLLVDFGLQGDGMTMVTS